MAAVGIYDLYTKTETFKKSIEATADKNWAMAERLRAGNANKLTEDKFLQNVEGLEYQKGNFRSAGGYVKVVQNRGEDAAVMKDKKAWDHALNEALGFKKPASSTAMGGGRGTVASDALMKALGVTPTGTATLSGPAAEFMKDLHQADVAAANKKLADATGEAAKHVANFGRLLGTAGSNTSALKR